MKQGNSYKAHINGVLKDSLIIVLLFGCFSFINIPLAAFIGVICTAIFLTRRIILDYNPGSIKGYHIYNNGRELLIPNGIDVFDLSKVPSAEYLSKYVEVIRGILNPPQILIIRFCEIFQLDEFEFDILKKVILQLKRSKIMIILSDVEKRINHQFEQYEIENEIGTENIFYSISDAVTHAKKHLRIPLK